MLQKGDVDNLSFGMDLGIDIEKEDIYFEKEFILWGLVQFKKLSQHRFTEGVQFKDPYGSFISGL